MTTPAPGSRAKAPSPVVDVDADLARLAEQFAAIQRQVTRLETEIAHSESRSTALTDAKFVTYRTLIDSQADKVKLALEATEKAIDKAEIATSKAIDKESLANDDRFAKVNEFRAQQTELIGRFATLERVDLLYNQTRLRMDEVNNNVIARISDVADRVTELGTRITAIESAARGAQGNKTGMYAAIAAAGVLLAIIVFIASAWPAP